MTMPLPSLLAALRELLVADGKAEVGEIGNIGTVGKDFRARGHNVVGSNIIANLQESLGLQWYPPERSVAGNGLMLGPRRISTAVSLFLRGGSDHHVVVDEEMLGQREFRPRPPRVLRIGKYAG